MGNVLAFILLIGPLIFVHELGHLLVAKLVGVKVLRFSIGFGPPLLRTQLGETEYVIAPIPLGGYVTLLGQNPYEEITPADAERALGSKPLWARFAVLGAGPAANLVLPVVLFFFFFLGHTALTPAVIGTVVDGSAAADAELIPGDRIVAIDGSDVRSWKDMAKRVSGAPEQQLRFQVERDGKRFDRIVTPHRKYVRSQLGRAKPVGRLGVLSYSHAPQIGVIDPDSPAFQEGLRTGDIITSINGEPVTTAEDLVNVLELSGDARLRLTYLRPEPVRGALGTYLWYDSHHAQLLPRKENDFDTGLLPGTTFVRSVDPGSPAATAGIVPGDRILSVDGTTFRRWEFLAEYLGQKREQAVTFEVQSMGQEPRTITVTQRQRTWVDVYKNEQSALWFGATPFAKFRIQDPEPIRGRFTYALSAAVDETMAYTTLVWTVLAQTFAGERDLELSGPVGLFAVAGTAADQGPGMFLQLMAIISVNLAIVNLLPIPVLDGGHLLFFAIEGIRRRPLGQRGREIASAVGLIIIAMAFLFALYSDIVTYYVGGG